MAEKKSFLIYKSWGTLIENLDDATAGVLVKAIFAYQRGEDVDITDPVLSAVFKVMAEEFDENDAKYKETCRKRKEAISKRWDTKEFTSIQDDTKVYKSIQSDTDNECEPDNELDSDSDSDNESLAKAKEEPKGSKKKKTSKKEIEVVPTYDEDPKVNAAIIEFFDYRKSIRHSVPEKSRPKMLDKLSRLASTPEEKIAVLNQSMENGWQGIFPLDKAKERKEINWDTL